MLIGYTPLDWTTPPTVSLAGGTWLTPDGGAACVDGKPARKARLSVTGSPTITLTLPVAKTLRVVAVLGLRGVAAGSAIAVMSDSGNANALVRRFADGTLGAWLLLPATGPTSSVSVSLSAAGEVDIGEIVAMPAVELVAGPDWIIERIDPSNTVYTVGSAPDTVRRSHYRRLSASLTAQTVAEVRAGGLAGGMDWEQLGVAMIGSRRMCAVPRWRTPAGTVDAEELNRTAIYGTGVIGPTPHVSAGWHSSSLQAQEVPADVI